MRKLLLACLLFVLFPAALHAQALAPTMHHQFLDSSGKPLAGGFLYSYQAGTSTLQATYADAGLTIANANPIPLDATGSPSNSSGAQVEIWLSNASYKFCAYSSSLVQQWCADGVTTYLGLLNQTNTWTFAQTFTQPVTITATDNQLVFGASGNQTTLDLPPPTGNITLHMPSTADTMVGRATTDTLTNKTLTSPMLTTPTATNPILNGVNTQTGTSYTAVASDEEKLVTLTNSLAIAVTLPQATTAGFGNGTKFSFQNRGLGTATITPTASTIDGAASVSLATGQGIDIYSDGTNYWTQRGISVPAIPVSQVDLTAQATNCSTQTFTTPVMNGFYKLTLDGVVTQAATTSSQTPAINLNWTDADSNAVKSLQASTTTTGNVAGTLIIDAFSSSYSGEIYAKAGVAITLSCSGYSSVGAQTMQYAIHARLLGPF